MLIIVVAIVTLAACYVCENGAGGEAREGCEGLKLDAGRDGGARD